MTTEIKMKVRFLYIVVLRAVKKPVKNAPRRARNLLEMAARLFPSFRLPEKQWDALCGHLGGLIEGGRVDEALALLEQAALPPAEETATHEQQNTPDGSGRGEGAQRY